MESVLPVPNSRSAEMRSGTIFLPSHKCFARRRGPRKFLASLLKRYPTAKVTCVDASEQMLESLASGFSDEHFPAEGSRICPRCRFLLDPPVERYDLIAARFFLDCFPREQLGAVIEALQTALRPGASGWSQISRSPKGVSGGCALGSSTGSCMAFGLPKLPASRLVSPRPFLPANTASSACGVRSSIGVCSLPSFGGAPSRCDYCWEGVVRGVGLWARFNGPAIVFGFARKRQERMTGACSTSHGKVVFGIWHAELPGFLPSRKLSFTLRSRPGAPPKAQA